MDPLTLLARLLSALVSPIAKWANGRLELSNIRAKHNMEQGWKAEERWHELQREALTEIQDLLFDLGRVAGSLQHQDLLLFRTTGRWGAARSGEQEGERSRLAIVRLNKLKVIVDDEPLLAAIEQFKSGLGDVVAAKSEEQSGHAMTQAMGAVEIANQRIGALLRALLSGHTASVAPMLEKKVRG